MKLLEKELLLPVIDLLTTLWISIRHLDQLSMMLNLELKTQTIYGEFSLKTLNFTTLFKL